MPTLGEYDGQPITKTKVRLVKAGDGLSEAMSLDPEFLHIGETVDVVVRAVVTEARLHPVDTDEPEGDLVQVATLTATDAAWTDAQMVGALIAQTRERIERARGNEPLPGLSVEDDDEV